MDINELEIPVPWGHISVKAWGDPRNTPVLAIHGMGDNAGSYDRLIPFLPSSFYYLCIDLPGHGKSSSYPSNILITTIDNIMCIKMIVDHLDRKNYIFMGHSWGGQMAVLFTQLYPSYVIKLVSFDAFHIDTEEFNSLKDYLIEKFDTLIKVLKNEDKTELFSTYEEALTKFIKTRMLGELPRESAEGIIKRLLISDENGKFRFTTDPRIKSNIHGIFGMKFLNNVVKRHHITCPMLFVYSTESQYSYFKSIIDTFQKHNSLCIVKKVPGSHDVHNNNPEIVGPIVSEFLLNVSSKL